MLALSAESRLNALHVTQQSGCCNEFSTLFALGWGEGDTDLVSATFSQHLATLVIRRSGMYDVRPDQVGWTVFDVETGRAAVLDDLVLIELEHEAADELAALLNRNVYGSRPKRLSRWPLPAASRPQSSQG